MRKDAAAREAIPPRPRPKMQEPGHRDALVGPFCQPDELDWLLFFTCLFHLYVCPYTKVRIRYFMPGGIGLRGPTPKHLRGV
jgi:hypothetical protein